MLSGRPYTYTFSVKTFLLFSVIHTVKGFNIVSEEEEEDVFLEFSCFFYDSTHVGNLISGMYVCVYIYIYIYTHRIRKEF